MNQSAIDREDRLYALAQEDPAYIVWSRSHEKYAEAYQKFYLAQSEDVQSILSGYIDCGFVAMQRLVNLACDYMVFPDEE